jgi:hypothetical protein
MPSYLESDLPLLNVEETPLAVTRHGLSV